MSSFLEEVLAHPPAPKKRRITEGLAGSRRRYAILVTLMVGLTVTPTWIMLRAGVEGLDPPAAAPARPIVMGVPDQPTIADRKPTHQTQTELALPFFPPKPVAPQPDPPILERRSVVDTSVRPTVKRKSKAAEPAPASKVDKVDKPAKLDQPAKSKEEPVMKSSKPKKKRTPHVEKPERPRVERPQVVRPDSAERARS